MMRKILYGILILFFVACGNEHQGQGTLHLKGKSELNSSVMVSTKVVEKIVLEEQNLSNRLESETLVPNKMRLKPSVPSFTKSLVEISDKNSSFIMPVTLKNDDKNLTQLKSEKLRLAELSVENSMRLSHDKKEVALAQIKSDNALKLEHIVLKSKEEISKLEIQATQSKLENEKTVSLAKVNTAQEVELATLKSKEEVSKNEKIVSLAKVNSEQELKLASFKSSEAVALSHDNMKIKTQDKDNTFYERIAIIIASVLTLLLFVLFMMHRRSKNMELKLQEEELRHKEMMESSKQYHENVRKMLEIVADDKADKGVKKEIVRLLKDQENQKQKKDILLIEKK